VVSESPSLYGRTYRGSGPAVSMTASRPTSVAVSTTERQRHPRRGGPCFHAGMANDPNRSSPRQPGPDVGLANGKPGRYTPIAVGISTLRKKGIPVRASPSTAGCRKRVKAPLAQGVINWEIRMTRDKRTPGPTALKASTLGQRNAALSCSGLCGHLSIRGSIHRRLPVTTGSVPNL